MQGKSSIHVDAPPEKVYAMVSDVTRMGEWSPECYKCEWLGGASGPAVGAQFKGYNKSGLMRWSTSPTVKVADPGKEFTFEVGPMTWSYRFASANGGTEVTESYEGTPTGFLGLFTRITGRERALRKGLPETLRRLKAAAEA